MAQVVVRAVIREPASYAPGILNYLVVDGFCCSSYKRLPISLSIGAWFPTRH